MQPGAQIVTEVNDEGDLQKAESVDTGCACSIAGTVPEPLNMQG
jgi:hypothetical protein